MFAVSRLLKSWWSEVSPLLQDASRHSDSESRGQARWQWWVTFATVSCPLWFNRQFLVQWTALWVIRIPLLPAVALPYSVIWMKESPVCVWGGSGGVGLVCPNSSTIRTRSALHTHTQNSNSPLHLPDVDTPNQPSSLTSVHPCVSNWNMNGFPLGWNRTGLPFPETLFLTGLVSLPTDCPHGYSCCRNTPATAKSTKLS